MKSRVNGELGELPEDLKFWTVLDGAPFSIHVSKKVQARMDYMVGWGGPWRPFILSLCHENRTDTYTSIYANLIKSIHGG